MAAGFKETSLNVFKYVVFVTVVIICWIITEHSFGLRDKISIVLPSLHGGKKDHAYLKASIPYQPCTRIPAAPPGRSWPEERYRYEPATKSILDIADPLQSKMRIEGSSDVKLGDTIHVKIQMIDGRGKERKTGGDLIRVWMREPVLGASSTANVIDNRDGTYSAILTAFWTGTPEVVAALVMSRETIATTLKRRYTCPQVLMNTAMFEHPLDSSLREETACNFDPDIPGYTTLCNFTEENFGSPWYCGKPAVQRLQCNDWSAVSNINLWENERERSILSAAEYEIMSKRFGARMFPTRINIRVQSDSSKIHRIVPETKCNKLPVTKTWDRTFPTGYLYEKTWTSRHCSGINSTSAIVRCLQNITILLIGDSTGRQLFYNVERKIPCKWVTDTWSESGKHRFATCVNTDANFTMTYAPHQLPFATGSTPRQYLKSFQAYLNNIQNDQKMIIILHAYAHFVNHHSHVFYETLKSIKRGVVNLLNRNKYVYVVIKGPHAFSFAKESHAMWMPDKYAEIYSEIIYNEFKDINDRVIYMEALDVTISTEQWHIHAEYYVIETLVEKMFSYICPY